MPRIRSIKPEFWQDELVGTLPFHTRLLFIGLWTIADDEGRFRANPRFVHAQVFPYDAEVDVGPALRLLEQRGRIQLYEAEGQSFGWVRKFNEHQRIDKPKPSVLPAPPPEASPPSPGRVLDESPTSPGRKGEEGRGGERSGGERSYGPPPPPPPEASGKDSRTPVPIAVTAPEKPEDEWEGLDFWRWFQAKRQEARLVPEKPPHPSKLSAWWSLARGAVVEVESLRQAAYRFSEDAFWRAKDPPCPWAGFASQWDRFVPPGGAHVHP